MVRISKAVLETGETELLVSSRMHMESFATKDLVELYGTKWVWKKRSSVKLIMI